MKWQVDKVTTRREIKQQIETFKVMTLRGIRNNWETFEVTTSRAIRNNWNRHFKMSWEDTEGCESSGRLCFKSEIRCNGGQLVWAWNGLASTRGCLRAFSMDPVPKNHLAYSDLNSVTTKNQGHTSCNLVNI